MPSRRRTTATVLAPIVAALVLAVLTTPAVADAETDPMGTERKFTGKAYAPYSFSFADFAIDGNLREAREKMHRYEFKKDVLCVRSRRTKIHTSTSKVQIVARCVPTDRSALGSKDVFTGEGHYVRKARAKAKKKMQAFEAKHHQSCKVYSLRQRERYMTIYIYSHWKVKFYAFCQEAA